MNFQRVLHTQQILSGKSIAIYEYESDGESGTVLFPPAMAVRQHFYRHYASYLAQLGYRTYTFDYSGVGKSRHQHPRKSRIQLVDWIAEIAEVGDWVKQRDDPDRYYYITHSLGGQFFGLLDNPHIFDAMISITSQNGYWRFYRQKYSYFFFWYFLAPFLYQTLGYFPGSKVGMGVDLPKAVMQQWKRWCTSENYFFDDDVPQTKNFEKFDGPLLTLSFGDDPWATKEAVDDLVMHYTSAQVDHRHILPKEVELEEIGHFGFFLPENHILWKITTSWMRNLG